MERCPGCGELTLSDSGRGYKRCFATGCAYRVYSDGSVSFIRFDKDKIRRIKKDFHGNEKTLSEFSYP